MTDASTAPVAANATGDASNPDIFLSKVLQKLLSEKEVKRSTNAKLKQACEAALADIGDGSQPAKPPPKDVKGVPADGVVVDANKYFHPFRLACESKSARIVQTAVDGLQKLMAYGHITGQQYAQVAGLNETPRLINLVVDIICRCFQGESTDKKVQLQVIKALLTAVTSSRCAVHEGTLMKAVRTCYNIYLVNHKTADYDQLVNQTTAKATLTQMLSLIFSRLETTKSEAIEGEAEGASPDAPPAEVPDGENGHVPEEATSQDAGEDSAAAAPATPAGDAAPETPKADEGSDTDGRPTPPTSVHGAAMAYSDDADGGADVEGLNKFGHVFKKDAFLVFRSMCKLSMKELPGKDVVDLKSHELRSKVLSLELLLAILQAAGDQFQSDPMFIEIVVKYLCVSLSKNGVSHVPVVFERSLSIFLVLLSKFKTHLKMQIEVFFKEILFSMLELSTSSFQHKHLVMVCLTKICSDTQTIFDLYLNYDCDEFLNNLYERLVNDVSRVSQGRASSDLCGTPQQEIEMKVKGLECLVLILRCMRDWCPQIESATEDGRPEEDVGADEGEPSALHDRYGSEPSGLDEDVPASTTDDFEARKYQKDIREKGINLFNKKPKKGIKFLQDHKLLGTDEKDIAAFLHAESRLDRTQIGEYLGEPGEHNIKVMHLYTEMINFEGLDSYVDSLRLFLGGFRLPGEAQKIDRLMEKFAGTWFERNPKNGIFASADAAYVLAYSIIMLTTDLHSTKIKKKMTLEEFINNNRGINDGNSLPPDYLTSVYAAIEKEEIKMKGPQTVKVAASDIKSSKDRKKYFEEQMRDLAGNAEDQMKAAETSNAVFLRAHQVEQARPMFKVAWQALLASLTRPLQESEDEFVISLCLEGLRDCIHIACIFDMEESKTFLQSLAKFTNLSSNLAEIKHKHVEAIKTLLHVGFTEGNYLGDSWKEVLRCVSQLEIAIVIGSTETGRKNVPDVLTETASQSIVISIDKIFANSRKLNGEAIVCFVRWLCYTSSQELHTSPPRLYSLTKLVEIAYYNMERIRLEWSHIWAVMGEHFNKVGCMPNADIANSAVDSLRQLSMKFLEKGELANYSFQKDFLRPFEYIMTHNKNVRIRDLVVCCVAQMVQAKATNIRSGWKNIFFVFSLAASDNDQNIVDLAFTTTKLVFEEHFSEKNAHRATLIAGSFMDAVNCLAEFASNSFFPDISMEAISLLRICANHVHDSPELFEDPEEERPEEPKIWVRGWFPVLFGLSRIINRCKLDVRTRALTVMMDIMKTYGGAFLKQWWKDIFNVVFRIFDDKKLQGMHSDQERIEWMDTTCDNALRSIIDVVSQYFEELQDALLADIFDLLHWCIHREHEHLARTGTECLHILIMSNGAKFKEESWELAVKSIKKFFKSTEPRELMDFQAKQRMDGDKPAKLDEKEKAAQQDMFSAIIIKCVVQLSLIQTVEWIMLSSTQPEETKSAEAGDEAGKTIDAAAKRAQAKKEALGLPVARAGEMLKMMNPERLFGLLDCLMESHHFAQTFNANKGLRTALWKAGFMKNRSKPNLLKQETTSLSCALRIMFRVYESENHDDCQVRIEEKITEVCSAAFAHFVNNVQVKERDIWAPLISLILQEFLRFGDDKFAKHAAIHHSTFCEMLELSYDQPLGAVAFYVAAFFKRASASPAAGSSTV